MLEHCRIILINTTHPGNIGAVARAMKNMGLTDLYLVSPKIFPSEEATARAGNAADILESACVVKTVEEAIADCHYLLGLSARVRKIPLPLLTPREAAQQVGRRITENPYLKVAFLFGQEQNGLLNEELSLCHDQIQIPANPDYASLNLSQAVQIISYELRLFAVSSLSQTDRLNLNHPQNNSKEDELAPFMAVQNFYERLERVLKNIHFLQANHGSSLMTHLKRLYNRTQLTVMELNILQGILTSIEKSV